MKNKIGFFEEEEGVRSMTRLMSFLTLLFTFLFAWYYLIVDAKPIDTMFLSLFFLLLLASFAPKYLQKIAELKKEETQIITDGKPTEEVKEEPKVSEQPK
jgi:hypothetical protein